MVGGWEVGEELRGTRIEVLALWQVYCVMGMVWHMEHGSEPECIRLLGPRNVLSRFKRFVIIGLEWSTSFSTNYDIL